MHKVFSRGHMAAAFACQNMSCEPCSSCVDFSSSDIQARLSVEN